VLEWIATGINHDDHRLGMYRCILTGGSRGLEGKSATTHWEDIADLRAMFPTLSVKEELRWVDEGAIVSSAGISAGIDMSLHLVERLKTGHWHCEQRNNLSLTGQRTSLQRSSHLKFAELQKLRTNRDQQPEALLVSGSVL
jgi:transcriptional regulator GlxA family with amidase domain